MKSNINASVITSDKSLQVVNADLTKLDIAGSQVNIAIAELNSYSVIKSKLEVDDAMALLKLCKDIENAIEKKRKELVGPFNDSVKQINTYAKDLTGKLSTAIDAVKNAVLKFQKEEQQKALQARTIARQTALIQLGFTYDGSLCLYKCDNIGNITDNELQQYEDHQFNAILQGFAENINRANQQQVAQAQEENELNEMFGDVESDVFTVTDPAPLIVTPINSHKVETVKGTTKRWTFDIINEKAIPREYLKVDETAIRQAIAAGVRIIPGVSIYQSESLSIR